MDPEIIIPLSIFGVVFGVFYLYISSRNRERLALIEKGADASIFARGKRGSMWKIITLNIAFLLMGTGVGVLIANILDTYTGLDDDAVYPSLIFLMAGVGLYVGFTQARKFENE